MCDKDWGMSDGADVHGKWDGIGCTEMVRCPVPEIWPRSLIPPPLLQRLQHQLFNFHALNCKQGGLVTARDNYLRDGVADLARNVFTPSRVCDDPLIFAGCAVKRPKLSITKGTTVLNDMTSLEATEQNSGLVVRDLCQNGTDSVQGMCVVNIDAKYHSAKTP